MALVNILQLNPHCEMYVLFWNNEPLWLLYMCHYHQTLIQTFTSQDAKAILVSKSRRLLTFYQLQIELLYIS